MASGWKRYGRSIVAIVAFEIAYTFSLLTTGVPYIAPFSFIVVVLVSWEIGLIAGLAWVGLIHILIPCSLALVGIGPYFVFSEARGVVFALMVSSLVVETVLAFLTVRLHTLNRQLRKSKGELLQANVKLQAVLAEVKELRGMLPICAWCNRIRDDAGGWEKIESYIAKNSHATFTHGMCPECFQNQLNAQKNSE